jgi:hypothetical protein
LVLAVLLLLTVRTMIEYLDPYVSMELLPIFYYFT